MLTAPLLWAACSLTALSTKKCFLTANLNLPWGHFLLSCQLFPGRINSLTHFAVVCKLMEGALHPLGQIIDKDIKPNPEPWGLDLKREFTYSWVANTAFPFPFPLPLIFSLWWFLIYGLCMALYFDFFFLLSKTQVSCSGNIWLLRFSQLFLSILRMLQFSLEVEMASDRVGA